MTIITFVTPWYGPDAPGGAEAETRRLVGQLRRAGVAVEVLTTTTRDLNVYVHGPWSQMRLRNDNGDWSDWQPFANSFTWTIADGRGEHYVAAELRSGGTTR